MPAMTAPKSGVKIRMYRQGHGDCFLLAFPRRGGGKPVYMMIDCGYKPGSQKTLKAKKIADVVKHIGEATDKFIDVVVITHEHQDHVNGLGHFKDFTFGQAWFAWTEDPDDDVANALRRKHKDQLLGLLGAREQMASLAMDDNPAFHRVSDLLSLELGGEDDTADSLAAFSAAGKDPKKSQNKRAMKLIKDRAKDGLRFLRPHEKIESLPEVDGIRVFALGPPLDPDLLDDEDPRGNKAFPGHGIAGGSPSFFSAAAGGSGSGDTSLPFARRHSIPRDQAFDHPELGPFFSKFYGPEEVYENTSGQEPPVNAPWRRIDGDWLFAAEDFALKLNKGINNTSLVLAFELPATKKVLLFIGDAQLGNWESWTAGDWQHGGETVTARDLLARTVLYKVGHHGSHNATLKGEIGDQHPNLSWMGQGEFGGEFTAMITAVRSWALTQKPIWDHPLESIKKALLEKCRGRVFQTDTDAVTRHGSVAKADWEAFERRVVIDGLYFEYTVPDE